MLEKPSNVAVQFAASGLPSPAATIATVRDPPALKRKPADESSDESRKPNLLFLSFLEANGNLHADGAFV